MNNKLPLILSALAIAVFIYEAIILWTAMKGVVYSNQSQRKSVLERTFE